MKEYKFNIYSHSELIGYSDFEYGDSPMGTAYGDFIPTENYENIKDKVKQSELKNNFSDLGLSATDSVSGQDIENLFIAIFIPTENLKGEPIQININGIPSLQYEDIFPQHVVEYKKRFDNIKL